MSVSLALVWKATSFVHLGTDRGQVVIYIAASMFICYLVSATSGQQVKPRITTLPYIRM